MKKFVIAACMALLLIGGGFAYATPTSYLSVDINPSVELGINALGSVVNVQAFNDDGKAILSGIDIKGMQVDKAVGIIVDAAIEKGYIKEDGSSIVSITAATDDKDEADKLTKDAEEGASEALKENDVAAEVSQAAISEARRAAAIEAGISPGKMNLIQKLWEAENGGVAAAEADFPEILELAKDKYADAPVKDIMKAINAKGDTDLESNSAVDDADKPDKGKANAPGQQLQSGKAGTDEQVLTLPNGKVKKAPVESEDEEAEKD